ncbi:MAG: M48 family peptidase, partial [Deltaproteobacteria bacterium]|nr:M48 family peptidase [Deltaproteobacteria bacterium]
METLLYKLIIAILIFDYVLERALDWLNASRMGQAIPAVLAGLYDQQKYDKQQLYQKTNTRFSLLTSTFSLVVLLVFLSLTGFARLHTFAAGVSDNVLLQPLIFFGLLMLAQDLISLPFQLYQTFVIEERFGFNKITPKLFVMDKIKGWLLMALLGGGVLFLITWFYY